MYLAFCQLTHLLSDRNTADFSCLLAYQGSHEGPLGLLTQKAWSSSESL